MRPLLALTLVAGLAAPALAFAAIGPQTLSGVWESPWPKDLLPVPGAPPPPVEMTQPPLKPQYFAAWKAKQKADADAIARGEPPVTNATQCLPPGMPFMMSPVFPMEVLQTSGQVTIIAEAYSQVRRIYLGEKQIAVDDAEPEYFGHSVGHWEGKTLVVNTIGIKEKVRARDVPHSANMIIDERIEATSEKTFEDHITVTDPEFLTAPWSWTFHYVRKPDYKINEFVCDNNREFADPVTGGQRMKLGD